VRFDDRLADRQPYAHPVGPRREKRFEYPARVLGIASLDINSVIRDVIELMRGQLRQYAISIETELSPTLQPFQGNRVLPQQAVLNLVNNSIEAMAEVVEERRVLQVKSAYDLDGYIRVCVEDTGPGIPADAERRVFEPFFSNAAPALRQHLSVHLVHHGAHVYQRRLSAAPIAPRPASAPAVGSSELHRLLLSPLHFASATRDQD
jgi:hypothetical protein